MDAVCNYCKSEVELDNNEVLAKSFKCPICDKQNDIGELETAKKNELFPSGNDVMCIHCGSEIELDDSEVLAHFFRCPICNKGNNLEEPETDKYIGGEAISEEEKNADKKNELVLSSNDGVCKYCKEVVELDDNEIAAKSFKCPICEKKNKYWWLEAEKKKIKNRLFYTYLASFIEVLILFLKNNSDFFSLQIVWLIILPVLLMLLYILISLIILSLIFVVSLFKFKLTAYRVSNIAFWVAISGIIAWFIKNIF